MPRAQPITLLVCALGGEGGSVLAEWLVAVARHAGHAAQSSSIPGVAQRTGATTYYLEFAREPVVKGAAPPIFALAPVPGQIDLLLASELLEAARQITLGMSTSERTTLIASTARALTTAERMHGGDGRLDAERLQALLREHSRDCRLLDMAALAREAGTVTSAVLLGCVAASGVLPFARAHYEAVLGAGKAAEASRRGFALGLARTQLAAAGEAALVNQSTPAAAPTEPSLDELIPLGHARVVEYQDAAYGALYRQRLAAVQQAELAAGATELPATRETARWLALWMAFDDIVRVAELKSRAARLERVRAEVKAGPDEVLKVWDHFKPGIPEVAALLPAVIATRLQRWDARRSKPFALPLKLATHSVSGLLMLRALASLRWLRRRGQRFSHEQQLIERWLQGVCDGLAQGAELGLEVARCGRLIKGYGSTNERGKERLLHVLGQLLASPNAAGDRARAIAAAREAALADDSGRQLDALLRAKGAHPLPPREQPVRWVRKPASPVSR